MRKFILLFCSLVFLGFQPLFAQHGKKKTDHAMYRKDKKMRYSSPSDISLSDYTRDNGGISAKNSRKADKAIRKNKVRTSFKYHPDKAGKI